MKSRIRQIGTDWKTYLGAMAAFTAALPLMQSFFDTSNQSLQWFHKQPEAIKWTVAGLLLLIGLRLVSSALTRRSLLAQPDCMRVEITEADQLVGRREDLRYLMTTCERHRLVFLPGESGSGKSTLARVGLLGTCRKQTSRDPSRLVPVYIDGSFLDWENGFKLELTRELKKLTDAELASLGTEGHPEVAKLFQWLGDLPLDALRQLLIIVDQFDDYVVRWKDKLTKDGLVIGSERLCGLNSDWALLAHHLRNKRLRGLFICRDDAYPWLKCMRFLEPAEVQPLPRLADHCVGPLLHRITAGEGGENVIKDPAFGWDQLKKRLQRDLTAADGRVLPIQLTMALEGLRHARFLTIREYERLGGLVGLERLNIERQVAAASQCGGPGKRMPSSVLLNSLKELFVSDGLKTRSATMARLAETTFGAGAESSRVDSAVSHLEANRILRRQPSIDNQVNLMLYHDFRARGINEAWLKANQSPEQLQQHLDNWQEAATLPNRWKAMLSLKEQLKLAWSRVSGPFRYGKYRKLAFWSTLKFAPLLLILIAAGFSYRQWDRETARREAEKCLAIGASETPSQAEMQKWVKLSGLPEHARLHALTYGLEGQPENILRRASYAVRAVIGLDPGGRLSTKIRDHILWSRLRDPEFEAHQMAIFGLLKELRPSTSPSITTWMLERFSVETDNRIIEKFQNAIPMILPDEKRQHYFDIQWQRIAKEQDVERLRTILAGIGKFRDFSQTQRERAWLTLIARLETSENELLTTHLVGHCLNDELVLQIAPETVCKSLPTVLEKWKEPSSNMNFLNLGDLWTKMARHCDHDHYREAIRLYKDKLPEAHQTRSMLDNTYWEIFKELVQLRQFLSKEDARFISQTAVRELADIDAIGNAIAWTWVISSFVDKIENDDVKTASRVLLEWLPKAKEPQQFYDLKNTWVSLANRLSDEEQSRAARAFANHILKLESFDLMARYLVGTPIDDQGRHLLFSKILYQLEKPRDGRTKSYQRLDKLLEFALPALSQEEMEQFLAKIVEKMLPLIDLLEDHSEKRKSGRESASLAFMDLANLCDMAEVIAEKRKTPHFPDAMQPILVRLEKVENPWTFGHVLYTTATHVEFFDEAQYQKFVKRLVRFTETKDSGKMIADGASCLTRLAERIDTATLQRVMLRLVARIKVEKKGESLERLVHSFNEMGKYIDPTPYYAEIGPQVVQQILTSGSFSLNRVFDEMKSHMDIKDIHRIFNHRVAMAIKPSKNLSERDFRTIKPYLDLVDDAHLKPVIAYFKEQMTSLIDRRKLEGLRRAVSGMERRFPNKDAHEISGILRKRMGSEEDPYILIKLTELWLPFNDQIQPKFHQRLRTLLKLIQTPKREMLTSTVLKHIEVYQEVKPETFNGNVYNLVRWVESQKNLRQAIP